MSDLFNKRKNLQENYINMIYYGPIGRVTQAETPNKRSDESEIWILGKCLMHY